MKSRWCFLSIHLYPPMTELIFQEIHNIRYHAWVNEVTLFGQRFAWGRRRGKGIVQAIHAKENIFFFVRVTYKCILTLFKTRSNGYRANEFFMKIVIYRIECVNVLTYTKQTMCWALGTPPMGQRSKSLRPWPVDSMREYIEKKR